MKKLIIIAAVAKNGIIGLKGKTPWNIPEEMVLFTAATMGHSIIMGRKTYESIGKPLPGRKTIILSRTLSPLSSPLLTVCGSVPDAIQHIQDNETAFVIGGQQIYAQMMPLVQELLISHLNASYKGDSWFPEIDKTLWKLVKEKKYPLFTHSRYIRI